MGCCGKDIIEVSESQRNQIVYHNVDLNRERRIHIDKKNYKDVLKINDAKNKFISKALKKNNEFRGQHGVGPLIHDNDLYEKAFILAKQLLTEGSNFDNQLLKYKNGEGLGMINLITEENLNPEILMKKWYEENKDYNFKEPESSKNFDCYNFTQMIWKNSTNFGIGYYCLKSVENEEENIKNNNAGQVTREKRKYCFVALYYPEGNKWGQYGENVLVKKPTPRINEIFRKGNDGKNEEKKNSKVNGHKDEEKIDSFKKETKNEREEKEREEKESTFEEYNNQSAVHNN